MGGRWPSRRRGPAAVGRCLRRRGSGLPPLDGAGLGGKTERLEVGGDGCVRGPDALHHVLGHLVELVSLLLHQHLLLQQTPVHVKQLVVLFLYLLLIVQREIAGRTATAATALLLLLLLLLLH